MWRLQCMKAFKNSNFREEQVFVCLSLTATHVTTKDIAYYKRQLRKSLSDHVWEGLLREGRLRKDQLKEVRLKEGWISEDQIRKGWTKKDWLVSFHLSKVQLRKCQLRRCQSSETGCGRSRRYGGFLVGHKSGPWGVRLGSRTSRPSHISFPSSPPAHKSIQ